MSATSRCSIETDGRIDSSASEVTTLWRYTNLFIIIIIFSPPAQSLWAAEN